MKRLPAISSDLRIRLEGAVEQVESAVVANEARVVERTPSALPALAGRWPQIVHAANEVAKHTELAELNRSFEAARASLETAAQREVELLGLEVEGLPAQLAAIARARQVVPTPEAEVIAWQPPTLGVLFVLAASALTLTLMLKAAGVPSLVAVGAAGLLGTFVLRQYVSRKWALTRTHVVMQRPRATSVALSDIIEVRREMAALVVRSAHQTLRLETVEVAKVETILGLLRRGVHFRPHGVPRFTRAGDTVVVDEHGLALVPQQPAMPDAQTLSRFEPRALAAALGTPYWSSEEVELSFGVRQARFALPNGDSLVVPLSEYEQILKGARRSAAK